MSTLELEEITVKKEKGSIIILKALHTAREGLTVRQLHYVHYPYEELSCTRVMMSHLVRYGLLRVDGRTACKCCFSEDTCYRISEQGRIHLSHRGKI